MILYFTLILDAYCLMKAHMTKLRVASFIIWYEKTIPKILSKSVTQRWRPVLVSINMKYKIMFHWVDHNKYYSSFLFPISQSNKKHVKYVCAILFHNKNSGLSSHQNRFPPKSMYRLAAPEKQAQARHLLKIDHLRPSTARGALHLRPPEIDNKGTKPKERQELAPPSALYKATLAKRG